MLSLRSSRDARPSDPGAAPADPLPPGLQVNPIQRASAPVARELSLALTVSVSLLLFLGTAYLIHKADALQALANQPMTVRLVLDEGSGLGGSQDDSGGQTAAGRSAEETFLPHQGPSTPFTCRTSPPTEPPDTTLPLDMPRELPSFLPGTLEAALPGKGAGIGSGGAGEVGNGTGHGLGGKRGETWIHSARGGDSLRVAMNSVDYKDYIPPEYPRGAQLSRISGDVVVEVTIDEDGHPVHWTALEGDPALIEATLAVLPRWHFVPVRYEGRRVSATFDVRVRFTLV